MILLSHQVGYLGPLEVRFEFIVNYYAARWKLYSCKEASHCHNDHHSRAFVLKL